MNKKGFVASYVVDFYAYLVFAIILIAFFVLVYWSGTPISGDKFNAQVVPNGLTTVLIKALQAPTQVEGVWTTPAEMISTNDEANADLFTLAIKNAVETAYPRKAGKDYGWLRVYNKEKSDSVAGICSNSDAVLKFSNVKASPYGDTGSITVLSGDTIYAAVNVPLKNSADYVVVALCFPAEYFK